MILPNFAKQNTELIYIYTGGYRGQTRASTVYQCTHAKVCTKQVNYMYIYLHVRTCTYINYLSSLLFLSISLNCFSIYTLLPTATTFLEKHFDPSLICIVLPAEHSFRLTILASATTL